MGDLPGLTPAELERLALLSEELGEAQQAIGKILRHGYDSCHPERPRSDNRTELQEELGHVSAAIHLLCESGDVDRDSIAYEEQSKLGRVHRYLHHQDIPATADKKGE
jgi:NTP pyrophosphatase (non-canonical NTP hydrolase)